MPCTCEECPMATEVGSDMHCLAFPGVTFRDFGRKAECGFESRPDWCPLRPLPEEHGRLVDVDAIIKELTDEKDESEKGYSGARKPGSSLFLDLLIGYLDGLPTIIEAEGD